VEVAHALAASGLWSQAIEMADKQFRDQRAREEEDAENSGGEVYEDWTDGIAAIALEMAKAGAVGRDPQLLEKAMQQLAKIKESLPSDGGNAVQKEKYATALQQLAVETARAGILSDNPKLLNKAVEEAGTRPSGMAAVAEVIAKHGDTPKASELLARCAART
jgi:hypothetical protein